MITGLAQARVATAGVCVVIALLFGALCWRSSLSANRHRDIDYHRTEETGPIDFQRAKTANGYDDVVTVVTARNFARYGFTATHFLPNRSGAPQVSFFDFSNTQCEARPSARKPIWYVNVLGQPIDMVALNGECIYTHYPPLADWVFGAVAKLGLGDILHYKILAALLNCAFLAVTYLWLRRLVSALAAAAAVALLASMPAFWQWGTALYYQPFQYLFLIGGMLCWRRFLDGQRRGWLAATWLLFCCESLVSYELVAAYGIAMAGLAALDRRGTGWAPRLRAVALVATAPVAGVLLHFGLRVSLFGLQGTMENATSTLQSRQGGEAGLALEAMRVLASQIDFHVLGLWLLAAAVGGVLVARAAARLPLGNGVATLLILLAAGVSFSAIFPATAIFHHWMMYRHLLPFLALLFALTADALLISLGSLATAWRERTRAWARPVAVGLAGVALSAVPLAQLVLRDAREAIAEVRWTKEANRHHQPGNLASRFLDVLYWKESGYPGWDERLYMAVDGRPFNLPFNPNTEFRIQPGSLSHYEIWWLEPEPIGSIAVLTSAESAPALRGECRLELLEDGEFRRSVVSAEQEEVALPPEYGGERHEPYARVRLHLSTRVRTRALRLTCGEGAGPIPLHEIEVF